MAQVKFASNMDKAGITQAIKSIQSRGASLDRDIQLTGLSVLAHIAQHKEVSLFQKLYAALPKGSRSNALVAWALAFGQIKVNEEKATKKEFPFLFDGSRVVTDIKGATEKPWFDFKKPADPADEFSVDAAFARFMETIAKQMKAGKIDPTGELVKALTAAKELVHIPVPSEGTEAVSK